MKNDGHVGMIGRVSGGALWRARPVSRPSLLHWVTTRDAQELRERLQLGWLPLDFETKLMELGTHELADQQLEKHCRLFVALLAAAYEGFFRQATKAECDRLLSVLAYVRKNEDAIPDYREHGLSDDRQEVHAAVVELAPLLQAFKVWRLRHQVPGMWAS